ncbi:hypothetical protein [Modestobacter sp. KNN46-3]|jgi:hypothetical protein|uniref:hypothetical protein n=1 Tax=Modestobacter sp. KNN46-3 TaxID=2711218 RepID=UPI0013DE8FF0|nr:hypothetical protein [Modestobacter sp. KNN46-3]
MVDVLVGVLFMGLLRDGLTLLGVTTFWQNVASGLALVAAIAIAAATHVVRGKMRAREAHRLDDAAPPAEAHPAGGDCPRPGPGYGVGSVANSYGGTAGRAR